MALLEELSPRRCRPRALWRHACKAHPSSCAPSLELSISAPFSKAVCGLVLLRPRTGVPRRGPSCALAFQPSQVLNVVEDDGRKDQQENIVDLERHFIPYREGPRDELRDSVLCDQNKQNEPIVMGKYVRRKTWSDRPKSEPKD